MGFWRKALLINGVPVAPNSPRERTARAAEQQVRLQRQAIRQRQPAPARHGQRDIPPGTVPADSPDAGNYQVALVATGEHKTIAAMKVIREQVPRDLKSVQTLVKNTPCVIVEGVSETFACKLAWALEDLDATVEVYDLTPATLAPVELPARRPTVDGALAAATRDYLADEDMDSSELEARMDSALND